MSKRRASLVKRSCVRVDRNDKSPEEALVETRLKALEAAQIALGARLAGIEGVVFALQHRVHELERATDPATTSPAPRDAASQPHLAARRR